MCFKKMRTVAESNGRKPEGINEASHVSIVKFVYTHAANGRGRKGGSDREMWSISSINRFKAKTSFLAVFLLMFLSRVLPFHPENRRRLLSILSV
jgi:hypothetical protein